MNSSKRILVAPLDWGLGHASRCVPVIRCLIDKGAAPVIAADGRPLAFLQNEFPSLEFVRVPGYNIEYPRKGSMAIKMMRSAPRILRGIRREHHALNDIITQKKIDGVISDSRFGMWTDQKPCVFITHQVLIKSPFAEGLLHRINKTFIQNYDECWIPDVKGEGNLSGDLANKHLLPSSYYIGHLSRFEKLKQEERQNAKYDLLVILSGPEPQRTIFEDKVLSQLSNSSLNVLVLQGKPDSSSTVSEGNITIAPHLPTREVLSAIRSSRLVLSRPGYSTIMDLAVTGGKAVFVPTPGQTEQEYLGELMMKRKLAYMMKQEKFDLQQAIKMSDDYKGFAGGSSSALDVRMDAFLARC